MAYGLPDNLWIGLLVMAIIILALLWKDKISKSSGGGGKTKTTPDGPEFNSIEHRPVNPDPGQEVNFKADYTANASIKKYWFKVDGKKRDTTITGGSLKTGPLTLDEGSYSYKAYVKDENGKDSTIGSSFSVNSGRTLEGPIFEVGEEWGDDVVVLVAKAETRSADNISLTEIAVEGVGQSENKGPEARIEVPANPGKTYSYTAETIDSNDLTAEVEGELRIPRNPSSLAVTANYEIINEVGGNVRIWSEVTEYSNEIRETSIHFRPEGAGEDDWVSEVSKGDIRAEIPPEDRENLRDGVYEIRAHAEDVENNEATDTATFRLGNEGGGGNTPEGDYPELVRIINQSSSNSLGDLGGFRGDEEVMTLLEQILEKVDGAGGDIRGPGMDAYQLLFALNSLGVDLDGGDNQQIVDELRMIRQQMDSGGMSQNELENALKNVLNDVFGQDLQSVIQDLDLGNGFDEDAIVRAIENKDIDFSEVTDRLDRLEQTVSQIQGQGGDISDFEQKLDNIESAVIDLKADNQTYQDLKTEIEALREEGVDVNLDMNDPLIIKLVEDIEASENPQAERERTIQIIRQEQVLTRRVLVQILGKNAPDKQSGGQGNKNEEDNSNGMSDEGTKVKKFDQKELNSLEDDINALSKFVDDFDQLDFQKAKNLKDEIEKEVNSIQSELNDVHNQAELFTSLVDDINDWSEGGKSKQDMIDEIENSYKHENKIREELKDIHNKMSEIRRKVKEVEDLCTQFNEVLGVSENEFSSTVDSITEDMHRMDNLIEHVNEYLQGHREGQGGEYIPDEIIGESPR